MGGFVYGQKCLVSYTEKSAWFCLRKRGKNCKDCGGLLTRTTPTSSREFEPVRRALFLRCRGPDKQLFRGLGEQLFRDLQSKLNFFV